MDVAPQPRAPMPANADYCSMDICDQPRVEELFQKYRPTAVIHLASLLFGNSEQDRRKAWRVNTTATMEILEQAQAFRDCRVIFASSIATYGGKLPARLSEDQPQWPVSLYGVTKVACERLGAYFREAHGVDFRCVRIPIVISPYASKGSVSAAMSNAFVESSRNGRFVFGFRPETRIAGMYVNDVTRAFVHLLEASREKISQPVYNLSGFNASMSEISAAIRQRLPKVEHGFKPDAKMDSVLSCWPGEIDDANARRDWGWSPAFDLETATEDFLSVIQKENIQVL